MNNLVTRTLAGAVFVAIMVGSLLFHPIFFGAFFLTIMIVALAEFYHISIGNLFYLQQSLAIFSAVVFFLLIYIYRLYGIDPRWIWATLFPLAAIPISNIFLSVNERRELSRFPYIYYGLGYIALPVSLASCMVLKHGNFDGIVLLCFFIMIWASDTGAYCIGSLLGQRPNAKKLAPTISPKKSWWGFWGGIVVCVIAAVILKLTGLMQLPFVHCIILSVIVSVSGVCGDLFESMWKRYFNVKDSGNCIPGHGGMLDRFDSALLAVPIGAAYLALFGLI